MKYQAELKLEKPEIYYTESEASIIDWTNKILAQYSPSLYPDARVIVSREMMNPVSIWMRTSDDNKLLEKRSL